MSNETTTGAPAPAETMEIQYVRLDELLAMVWEDNPKLHNDALIAGAIGDYGFIDAIGADLQLRKVVYGHGRLNDLASKMNRGEPLPRYIRHAEDGMWLVPVTPLHFDDVTQLYRAALMHNRAGVAKFDGRDYNRAKLDKALKAANAPQMALPGFGNDEVNEQAWQTTLTQAAIELPPAPAFDAFDASKLPDAPDAGLVNTAYVVMVSAPSEEAFREALFVLSLGTRKEARVGMKQAAINSDLFLSTWKEKLGPVITKRMPEPEPAPVAGAPATPKPERKVSTKRARFIGGLCAKCGGSKYERWGRDENGNTIGIVECTACGGAGTEEGYNAKLKEDPTLADKAEQEALAIDEPLVEW